jgi:ATP-dependent Clp protease ATP-binding subunit ClpB
MLEGTIVPGSQLVLDVFDDVVVFRKARKNERVEEPA